MYTIHFLQDSGIVESDRRHIESVAQKIHWDIRDSLGMEKCEIFFGSNRDKVLQGEVFQSFLCDADSFYVYVDNDALRAAGQSECDANLIDHLYGGLYATARIRCMNLRSDCGLQEEAVGEGLSAHFVCEQLGRKPKPHHTQLSRERADDLLRAMRDESMRGGSYEKWFRGSRDEGIPPLAAHALGFIAVGTYLEKRKKTSVRAIATPADEILSW